MKKTVDTILTYTLTPLSWLYAGVMEVRNWMFKSGILKEVEYGVPVISVGNITIGGTGKTPTVEHLVAYFSRKYNVAVLSRGYKRKTKGFIVASSTSTPDLIGDEPLQIYNRFDRRVRVAVCESRRKGIEELTSLYPDIELIVLDDAFQHRYVKPKVSIMLMDYNRPIYHDEVLPLGRLRESAHAKYRADMVIVTKCPNNLTPINYRLISKDLDLLPYQNLYFSTFQYKDIEPVFADSNPYSAQLAELDDKDSVLLVTGIAYPRYFVRHFKKYKFKVKVLHFPDHHDFSRSDFKKIHDTFKQMKGRRKIIVTTDKDAVRLMYNPYYPVDLKQITYSLPIEIRMLEGLEGDTLIPDLEKKLGLSSSSVQEHSAYYSDDISDDISDYQRNDNDYYSDGQRETYDEVNED